MKTCIIVKDGKKWNVVSETGNIEYTGNTRKSCFKYTWGKDLKVISYTHGDITWNILGGNKEERL